MINLRNIPLPHFSIAKYLRAQWKWRALIALALISAVGWFCVSEISLGTEAGTVTMSTSRVERPFLNSENLTSFFFEGGGLSQPAANSLVSIYTAPDILALVPTASSIVTSNYSGVLASENRFMNGITGEVPAYRGLSAIGASGSGGGSSGFQPEPRPVVNESLPTAFPPDPQAVIPAVPEPSTWGLLLVGFAGIAAVAHRRRRMLPV